MHINPTQHTTPIHYARPSHTPLKSTPVTGDRVQTSKEFELLARNLPELRKELAARPEKVEAFADFAEKPYEFDDNTINKILTSI